MNIKWSLKTKNKIIIFLKMKTKTLKQNNFFFEDENKNIQFYFL